MDVATIGLSVFLDRNCDQHIRTRLRLILWLLSLGSLWVSSGSPLSVSRQRFLGGEAVLGIEMLLSTKTHRSYVSRTKNEGRGDRRIPLDAKSIVLFNLINPSF